MVWTLPGVRVGAHMFDICMVQWIRNISHMLCHNWRLLKVTSRNCVSCILLFVSLQSISPSKIANVWIKPSTPLPPSLGRVELIATASAKPLLMSYSHYTQDTHTHRQSRGSRTQVYTKHTWNAQLKARNCLFHQLPLLRDQLGNNLITSGGKMQIGYTKGYSASSLI